jgi:hypothetical protein
LGATPKFIIIKNRDSALNWHVSHGSTPTGVYNLNNTNAINTGYESFLNGSFNPSNMTSTTFSTYPGTSTSNFPNGSGEDYIAYAFAEVEGFSKFGSYTGNGSADGPFIYTGFRPAWLMVKRTNDVGEWIIEDFELSPYNPASVYIRASDSVGEASGLFIDFLSNGFKLRNTGGWTNASGGTYIYMAFAENPFKNSLAR